MDFSKDELKEAKRQIDSTLHKLKETIKTFEAKENTERYKSQITLAKRRVKAFRRTFLFLQAPSAAVLRRSYFFDAQFLRHGR